MVASEASKLRREVIDRIADLKVEIKGDELRIEQLERELADEEKKDRLKVVVAPKQGGKLGVLMGLTRRRIDSLKSGMERLIEKKDEAEARVYHLGEMLAKFREEYNPNFNDEGVKRAVRAWENYDAQGRYAEMDTVQQADLDDLMRGDSEHGIVWEEFEAEEHDTDARKSQLLF